MLLIHNLLIMFRDVRRSSAEKVGFFFLSSRKENSIIFPIELYSSYVL